MVFEFCGVSGYSEVGKNMSAVRFDNDAAIFDMGFHMQKIASYEEEHGNHHRELSKEQMVDLGSIPNDAPIASWKKDVRALICSHAHFDHFGAIPYLAPQYDAPLFGTRFTLEVIRNMMHDDRLSMPNQLIPLKHGVRFAVGERMELELIHVTHSVPQSALAVLHTPRGAIVYANDFKLDDHPTFEKKPDYDRLRQIGKEGVVAVVTDSLYCGARRKTPSESVARELLRETLLETDNDGHAIILSCFASHIARLRTIAEFGEKLNRKVVFLGRSFLKYVDAAQNTGLIDFHREVDVVGYADKIRKKLSQIEKEGKGDYLIVCTGGQGEPRSVLARMLNKNLPFYFNSGDQVIFSNRVIPVEPNVDNRRKMEERFEKYGVRVFRDVHTSGHGSKEDLRELIQLLNPEHIIPSHGHKQLVAPTVELAKEIGYSAKQVHLLNNGQKVTF